MVLHLTHDSTRPKNFAVPAPTSEQADGLLAGKRVVIVEDEALTVMQLQRILRAADMDIVGAAANGRQGVDAVLESKPDIVLMDVNMPVMNGLDAAREILSRYPVCLIMLTAYSDPTYMDTAREIGASGYVLKPIDSRSLMPHLETAFQQFQHPPPRRA